VFLPRVQLGKSVNSPFAQQVKTSDGTEIDPTSFPYVKRDLIRFLGILAYQNRRVQDRIRLCGGIEVILNHCVIDERNPCKRSDH
jgi:ataxin-10